MVQGMVLAGVLAGSGLMATKMLNEQKMVQKGIETKDQIEELHNVVYSVLQNNDNCSRTMLANGVTGQFSGGSAMNTTLTAIQTANGENVVQVYDPAQSADENLQNRTYMNGNVQVKEIRVKYNPASATGMGTLEIIYDRLQSGLSDGGTANDGKRRMKAGYGAKNIRKVIDMRVQRNPVLAAKPFTSCYGVTSRNSDTVPGVSTEGGNDDLAQKLCYDMIKDAIALGKTPAFKWDNATSSCLPNSQCPDHQIYTGISSTGEVRCRNLNEWVDFNTMIQNTSGTCSPGQTAGFEITSTNPVRVRIKCQ